MLKVEDLDTLKPFNGQRSMGSVGRYSSRYNTPRLTPMLGSPDEIWGYRCTDMETRTLNPKASCWLYMTSSKLCASQLT